VDRSTARPTIQLQHRQGSAPHRRFPRHRSASARVQPRAVHLQVPRARPAPHRRAPREGRARSDRLTLANQGSPPAFTWNPSIPAPGCHLASRRDMRGCDFNTRSLLIPVCVLYAVGKSQPFVRHEAPFPHHLHHRVPLGVCSRFRKCLL
jgi:hypothetical protein